MSEATLPLSEVIGSLAALFVACGRADGKVEISAELAAIIGESLSECAASMIVLEQRAQAEAAAGTAVAPFDAETAADRLAADILAFAQTGGPPAAVLPFRRRRPSVLAPDGGDAA
jgi:hypothetical protein